MPDDDFAGLDLHFDHANRHHEPYAPSVMIAHPVDLLVARPWRARQVPRDSLPTHIGRTSLVRRAQTGAKLFERIRSDPASVTVPPPRSGTGADARTGGHRDLRRRRRHRRIAIPRRVRQFPFTLGGKHHGRWPHRDGGSHPPVPADRQAKRTTAPPSAAKARTAGSAWMPVTRSGVQVSARRASLRACQRVQSSVAHARDALRVDRRRQPKPARVAKTPSAVGCEHDRSRHSAIDAAITCRIPGAGVTPAEGR